MPAEDGAARERGLEELYRRHMPRARRVAFLMVGDPHLAEELAQDAFVKTAGRLVHLRDPEAFWPYLRRTIVNLSRNHFRHSGVQRRFLQRQEAPPPAPPPNVEDVDALRQVLLTLPERQRAALVLRFYEDLSEAQVAEILRCRPGTVRSLVSRGLAALRLLPELRGDDDG